MTMPKEYNLLTQKLLAEGYTADNYPDYVQPAGSAYGPTKLDNLHGGFEYTRKYRDALVFKTGCGLLVKGSELGFGSMSYMGIVWVPENNNPVITCPLRPDKCDKRFSKLLGGPSGGGLSKIYQCDCRLAEEPYNYEKSLRKLRDDLEREKRQRYDAFCERVHGHVCRWHMYHDDWSKAWRQQYDPTACARYCQRIGGICDLTHKPISKKRGNVFYDVKVTRIHQEGDLFDGQEDITIKKNVRFLEHPTSIDICQQIAKHCKEDIINREKNRRHAEILIYGTKVEVVNIRAEQRESRDLFQDLEDIKNGIRIFYDADDEKLRKQEKKELRQQAKERKIQKLEKKLIDVGYDSLEEYSIDRLHADRWLTPERREELEQMRKDKIKQEKEKPVQMSLFDFPEVMP